MLSQLPQFHAIEHIVLDSIDFAVPTLVEVTVEPVAELLVFESRSRHRL